MSEFQPEIRGVLLSLKMMRERLNGERFDVGDGDDGDGHRYEIIRRRTDGEYMLSDDVNAQFDGYIKHLEQLLGIS